MKWTETKTLLLWIAMILWCCGVWYLAVYLLP